MSGHVRRHPRGQALVEFALIAPWLFMLLFGIIEAGRFIFYYETLNNATREGARYAIVNGANSLTCPTGPPATADAWACDPAGDDVVAHVRNSTQGMDRSAIAVTPVWTNPPTNERGATVTVTASYSYTTILPFVPLPIITVEAESSLVINN